MVIAWTEIETISLWQYFILFVFSSFQAFKDLDALMEKVIND